MKEEFWQERWANNQLGWHQDQHNARLLKFWPQLELEAGGVAFVPLCGKSLDMHWLRAQGHRVYGVELAQTAVEAFWAEAGLQADYVEDFGGIACYNLGDADSPDMRIYCGDFFELSAPHLYGTVGTFDRGALVALPPEMRAMYADHIQRIIPERSEILLLTLEYDQDKVSGPPHSVEAAEVEALYGERCAIECLHREETGFVPPHFREHGIDHAAEAVYRIRKEE